MPATTPRPPSSEQVAAFDRNAWPRSIGMPGRNRRNPHKTNVDFEVPLSQAALAGVTRAGKFLFTTTGDAPISGFPEMEAEFRRRHDCRASQDRERPWRRSDLAGAHRNGGGTLGQDRQGQGRGRETRTGEAVIWWTIHDLRRTARTLMTAAGIDPDHAERALGHK